MSKSKQIIIEEVGIYKKIKLMLPTHVPKTTQFATLHMRTFNIYFSFIILKYLFSILSKPKSKIIFHLTTEVEIRS